MTTIISVILAVIGSSGLFAFMQFLITRKDKKDASLQEVIDAIKQFEESNGEKFAQLNESVDTLRSDLNEMDRKLVENQAITARVRILRASDEILHRMKHSKEWFDQLNDDITFYERYCKLHPEFRNNKATHAIANIDEVYTKALKDNDFL